MFTILLGIIRILLKMKVGSGIFMYLFNIYFIQKIRVWTNFSIVIHEKNGVLNAARVLGSCNSPPRSESRAGPCWGTRKIRFLLLKRS